MAVSPCLALRRNRIAHDLALDASRVAIYGLFGLIQAKINAKRNASAQELQTATFEQFLIDRAPVTST